MDNELALELSLKQEFSLIQHEKQVASLSQAQAQESLIELFRLLTIEDNAIRSLIKSGCGFEFR